MGMIRFKKEVIESWLSKKTTSPKTFEEVASTINVSPSLFSLILSGKRQITPNVLRKICDLTGYDVGDLCYYDRTKEPEEDSDK
ncbi:MAG: helix-turn-helix transcriptional regulator [Candidatus Omnitrophica bacterium]|nr:helix-turn-helix transcriptional regulator [Candidatus Omnitrophota bacterium]